MGQIIDSVLAVLAVAPADAGERILNAGCPLIREPRVDQVATDDIRSGILLRREDTIAHLDERVQSIEFASI
jgi:hypothetical protein